MRPPAGSTQTKMAVNNEDVQQISSACAIATQALEAIGNLQTNDIRNLAASTPTNSTSSSSIPPTNSASIATELKLEHFIEHPNSYHPTIKFTAEVSQLERTFLDTTVCNGERFEK